MNTIFICIIFLLLGILLASLIFPNKCKEGMDLGVIGGRNCQTLLNTLPNVPSEQAKSVLIGGPLGQQCKIALTNAYNNNYDELCTGLPSFSDDQIGILSSVSGISSDDLNNCDSGSGTGEEVVEDDMNLDMDPPHPEHAARANDAREPWREYIEGCHSRTSFDESKCIDAVNRVLSSGWGTVDKCRVARWALKNPRHSPIINANNVSNYTSPKADADNSLYPNLTSICSSVPSGITDRFQPTVVNKIRALQQPS